MKYVHIFLIFSLFFTEFTRFIDGARILAIFPLDAKSHFIMFEAVMKALTNAGHQVDVMSDFPQKEPHPNYTDISLTESVPKTMTQGLTYDFIHSFKDSSSHVLIDMAGNKVCHLLDHPELQKVIKNPPSYDLFITESFFASCWYAFGRHLKVPVVAISSSAIYPHVNEPLGNPLNAAFVSEISDGSIIHMDFWQRFRNTIFTLRENWQFKHYSEAQNEIIKKHFGPEMPGVRELERDVALLLANSHHTLNGIRPMTPAVVEIGGVHVSDSQDTDVSKELAEWLDESTNGFIYFSFGSLIKIESFPKATLAELYSGLEKISPLRILMRVLVPEELPSGLPKNVFTLKWIPQTSVLKHKNVRAFVTHGGLLGVQEALTFAVPLIGIPVFADQPLIIKNCVDRGVAVSLNYNDFTAEKFVAAVKAVVHDPKYKKNVVSLSQQFLSRPRTPKDTAVFWIEYILRHGKDALRSPAIHVTWWQLGLLDIYGSMMVTVLAILYVMKKLFSILFRKVFRSGDSSLQKKRN